MTLQEFLSTADADHGIALVQAQNHVEQVPVPYTANVMTMYIVGAGLYSVFTDTAATVGHPVRDPCLALMDRLRSESEFNLTPGDPMGEANIAMLDGMILGLPDHAAALTALKAQLTGGAVRTVEPFASTTLYDVLTARGVVPTVPVTVDGQGFVIVTTSAAVVPHSAKVYGYNPRTQRWQQVTRVAISDAGIYEARIDHPYRLWQLEIEDAYGVMV